MDYYTPNMINQKDHFIRYKKRYTKLSILSGILLAVFLPITVIFWFKVDAIRPNSQKVTVQVVSVYDAKFGNDVKVVYNNKTYKLINVTDSEYYKYDTSVKLGKPIEVLLGDDGKLYSNIEGMKTGTVTGKLYFAFLGITLVLICSTAVFIACVIEAGKREKRKLTMESL